LPQVLLFEGPQGVGKQRIALWVAQALLCEKGPRHGGRGPCGECRSCHLALRLNHPDVHWFVPVEPSKKGADADKLVELTEEALGEEVAARREKSGYAAPAGLAAHSMASVRLLLRRLAITPAMGDRKVFIIGDAERLAAQRGQEGAANALLKALEEPPADSVIILTAAEPDALLPTILSRVVRVRVGRVPDSVVTDFVQRETGLAAGTSAADITKAEGRIGRVVNRGATADAGGSSAAQRFVDAIHGGAADRYGFALSLQPFQARGGFTEMLDGLLEHLRSKAASGRDTRKVIDAIAAVMDARDSAQGNVNPQLLAAALADDLVGAV
jgi:DNA polymerase-3 subunit delta'